MMLVLLMVGVLFAPGCLANPSSTLKDDVARALEISKLQSVLADLHTKRSESSTGIACPLTRFHNRQLPTTADVTADRSMATMMTALRMLQEQGLSLKDLESDTVLREFARELADLPGCPHTTASCNSEDMFRSFNGTCNNLRRPTWGMAGAVQRRLLPAAYDDGFNHPRTKGVDRSPLPSARRVSNVVHRGSSVTDRVLTLHAFQFGQFLDHDLISTPVTSAVGDCCAKKDDLDNCFNINFAEDDQHQPRFKKGYCMEVKRSSGVNCNSPSNRPGFQRQQINKVTSFIDASNVYGSSEEQLQGLRDGTTPLMRVVEGADGPRLPNGNDNTCKANVSEGIHCSLAGDDRVNQVPSLTSYHNVFILEHNRLALLMRDEFPDDDGELFQKTRKLIIAIMQKIVYDEFLPSFLSPTAMKQFKLGLLSPYTYDPNLDPSISNEFGIAYRMGHTWIPRVMAVFTKELENFKFVRFSETFDDPAMTYIESTDGGPSGMEGLAYWMSAVNSPATDRILEDVVRNELFIDTVKNISFDLAALNIQRGRDHGLPSYNGYRKFCGLSEVKAWSTSKKHGGFVDHTENTMKQLKEAGYSDAKDVDLFTGALSEKPVPGGGLGPTMECIIGDQFRRLKYGDRFFYQNEETGFNKEQQAAIEKYSLASLMCRNYNFEKIHFPNIFRSDEKTSKLQDCEGIDDIDLTPFSPPSFRDPEGDLPSDEYDLPSDEYDFLD